MKSKFLFLAMVAGAGAQQLAACDICSIYAAGEAQGNGGVGFFAGFAEQYTYFGTLQDTGHKIANDGEYIRSSVTQVFAGYSFNDRLSIQLSVPFIARSFGSSVDSGNTAGIGDVSLIGNYVLYSPVMDNGTFSWSVLGGVKLPTGDANRLGDPDFANGIGGHDLALGSGSYDGIVGTTVSGTWKRFLASASMQYAIRTEGAFEHRYANDLTWASAVGMYVFLQEKATLSVQAEVSGEYKGKDTFSGIPDDDSAETIVYAGPQINFTWRSKLAVQAGIDIPLSIANSGAQVVPDYRVHGAVTVRF